MKTIASILSIILALSLQLGAQDHEVSGTVSDENAQPIVGASVVVKGTTTGAVTAMDGSYKLTISSGNETLQFSFVGYETQEVEVKGRKVVNVSMAPSLECLDEVVVTGHGVALKGRVAGLQIRGTGRNRKAESHPVSMSTYHYLPAQPVNTESYTHPGEEGFRDVLQNPLSTFSIDVDRASYSNVRRFLNMGQLPPVDAIRVEEMVNYFNYTYEQPKGKDPFSVHTELSACPWNEERQLLHVGLQGRDMEKDDLPPSNLVFLLDVSGSMNSPGKLPLLKQGMSLLVDQLRDQDRVAIVVYAGAAGLVLESTPGDQKNRILDALDKLQAGGSTAGGAGLKLAYKEAMKNFKEDGNNRIILATDGDFNVGPSSNEAMEDLIEKKRELGVFLTVLGFGMGNYQDDKMEILADKGNGNYAYIDNLQEARRTLVEEFGGTLFTIAKDVKFQIEFNPARVRAYRLIGYENRLLADEDFNNDRKDAGEIGAGHTVTALYEIIPAGSEESPGLVDPLKYQEKKTKLEKVEPDLSAELMTVKLRYKQPDGDKSTRIEIPVEGRLTDLERSSDNFRFSAAVAEFALLLGQSDYRSEASYEQVIAMARKARGEDGEGYRSEFIQLVKLAESLENRRAQMN